MKKGTFLLIPLALAFATLSTSCAAQSMRRPHRGPAPYATNQGPVREVRTEACQIARIHLDDSPHSQEQRRAIATRIRAELCARGGPMEGVTPEGISWQAFRG